MNIPILSPLWRFVDNVAALFARPRERQVAALVWRRGEDGVIEILTITTRRSKRWSVPKGWPIRELTSAEAAAQEAWEEAGVRGTVEPEPLGNFVYTKSRAPYGPQMRMTASIFALQATEISDEFPEAGQRKRAWRSVENTAEILTEPELKAIVRAFER